MPLPPAVTAAPTVSTPVVDCNEIVPLAAAVVEIAPDFVRLPVLVTLTLEPAAVPSWLIPVTVKVPAEFTRVMGPLVVLVALKLVTVLALPSVVPPTELVVSRAPLMTPAPG